MTKKIIIFRKSFFGNLAKTKWESLHFSRGCLLYLITIFTIALAFSAVTSLHKNQFNSQYFCMHSGRFDFKFGPMDSTLMQNDLIQEIDSGKKTY